MTLLCGQRYSDRKASAGAMRLTCQEGTSAASKVATRAAITLRVGQGTV